MTNETNTNPSIDEAIEAINKSANETTNATPVDARDLQVGEIARQGDLYIERIDRAKMPKASRVESTTQGGQLAPGNTGGSRHVCESAPNVWVKWVKDPDVTEGPYIDARRAFTITHPEHADFKLSRGCYKITYQLDAKTRERVAD